MQALGSIIRETRADWDQVVYMMGLQKSQLEAVVKIVEDGVYDSHIYLRRTS